MSPAPPPAVNAARDLADRWVRTPPAADDVPGAELARTRLGEVAAAGLLAAPLAPGRGGAGLGVDAGAWGPMFDVLRHLGRADLSVARLYEGHVNGVQLVETFGTDVRRDAFAADVRAGRRSAIWNTERPGPRTSLRMVEIADGFRLEGGKVFCSGSGSTDRPVICGTRVDAAGAELGWQMAVVPLDRVPHRFDAAGWDPLGVRGTATHALTFGDDAVLPADALVGEPGHYLREPWLTAGAARFLAVQVGACERLFELVRADLWAAKRTDHHGQRTRAAALARHCEQGRLWLDGIAARVGGWLGGDAADVDRLVAHVRLARTAVEESCHECLRLAEQSIGLRGLVRPHPLERLVRDLTVYLRQPALDTSVDGVGRFTLDESHALFAHELFDPAVPGDDADRGPNRNLRGTPFADPDRLPCEPPAFLRAFGRTAVLAPHPDDESLGVGGTAGLLRDAGLPVSAVFLTDGEHSHPGSRSHPPPVLGALRRSEARAACRTLGVADDAVVFLGLPDGGVPRASAHGFADAVDRLTAALSAAPGGVPHTLLTPWRREPHGDHRAAFDLATAAAGRLPGPPRVVEYAVHLWAVRTPADVPRPGEVRPVRVDVTAVRDRKRRAVDAHASQVTDLIADSPAGFRLPAAWRAACDRPGEILLLPPDARPADTVPVDYFAKKYADAPDPWDLGGSDYEAAKYDLTLAAIPPAAPGGRYRRGLELGCSVGVLTARLADRCESLLAVDAAPAAVSQARDRCRDHHGVRVETAVLPGDWPGGTFDLIVASEVLYYLSDADFEAVRGRIVDSLESGGRLLLVHWTVFVPDYPRTGDAVHDAFLPLAGDGGPLRHLHGGREPTYRLDLFEHADA